MIPFATRRAWAAVRVNSRGILLLLAGGVLGGCDANHATAPRPLFSGNGPNGKNAPVHITPANDTLDALGATLQLVADVNVTWTSLTPAVIAVEGSGIAVSVGPGLGLVRALGTGGRKADTATILVRQVPTALRVSPDSLRLPPGSSEPLTATAEDGNGYPIVDAIVTWVSDLLSVAIVSADGIVTGVDTGSTTVRAILGRLSDTTSVSVTAVPQP